MSDTLATLKYDYETNKRINYGAWVKAFLADKVIAALEAELAQARAAVKQHDTNMQERWDTYWTEVRRVLEANEVDEGAVYDAFHNATILMNNVIRKQATAQPADGQQQAGGE